MAVRKPNLLFISPVMPAATGNGLAMRAGMFLDALAGNFNVHLLVIPVAASTNDISLPTFVRERTVAAIVDPLERDADPLLQALGGGNDPARSTAFLLAWPQPLLCRFATAARAQRLKKSFEGVSFSVIHVMRLYMAPYARAYLEAPNDHRPPVTVLDLDDDEAATRERLAALLEMNGKVSEGRLQAREAARYRDLEVVWFRYFRQILVCSDDDRKRLAARADPEKLAVVPNAVRLPPESEPDIEEDFRKQRCTILFVGTLGYFPNEDAVLYFCQDILPLIRKGTRYHVQVRVVGSNPGPGLLALARLPGVEIVGPVREVSEHYRRAALVVIPIRAGGGTRIKLLEALAYRRAVVATRAGAEGVALDHDRHLMLADTPDQFAEACITLLNDPARARALAKEGHAVVRSDYSYNSVAPRLAELYRSFCA